VVLFGIRMKRRKRSYKLEQDLFKRLQKRLTEFSAGKREKVSGLDAYSYASKTRSYSPLDFRESLKKVLSDIVERNKKYLEDAQSQIEVMDALSNLDADIKAFRDEYYPKLSPVDRLEYEEIIRDIYKVLESYARRKIKRFGREGLDKILEF
jgi:hypothetical protein